MGAAVLCHAGAGRTAFALSIIQVLDSADHTQVLVVLWWLCASLWLDRLALVQEFQAREAAFWLAFSEHLAMVSIAVGISIVLGIILALLIRRYRVIQRGAFALLNFFQTIPSFALFGLLLAPLAWVSANVPFAASFGHSGYWLDACLAGTDYL